MDWDRSGYGTHRGTGVGEPRTSWFMAEGATIGRFSLFYLLQNPGDVPATVTIRYLIQALGSAPVVRTYLVAPRSRYTIGVHDDPALAQQELSAEITSDCAHRRRTRDVLVRATLFEAGATAMAAPAPSPTWYFAEGATGTYFETVPVAGQPGGRGRDGHRALSAARWQCHLARPSRFQPARDERSGSISTSLSWPIPPSR